MAVATWYDFLDTFASSAAGPGTRVVLITTPRRELLGEKSSLSGTMFSAYRACLEAAGISASNDILQARITRIDTDTVARAIVAPHCDPAFHAVRVVGAAACCAEA